MSDVAARHLLIATSNANKLREIRTLLAHVPVTLHSLAELPPTAEPEETGQTFQENARLKADYYRRHLAAAHVSWGSSALTVAEDSGLVIDALQGDPGVRSARYLGEHATYPERFADIYRRLAIHPDRPRTARFVCALVVMAGNEVVFETLGVVEGEVARAPAGSGGFGYDPIFYYPPYDRTLAEVGDEDKLTVAHRGHAFRALAGWLRNSEET